MKQISATEFVRNFSEYREMVQREPVAITNHGRATGYFVSAGTFKEYQKLKAMARRATKVADLPKKAIDAIAASRMDPAHDHLDESLKDD
jgi:prevent-host-death family protein